MRISGGVRALMAWVGVGLLAALLTAHDAESASSTSCDRACLEGFVDTYLEAMIAHDPRRAPFASDVKFTENGQKLELGDGLWRTITAKGTYRMFVADVESGHVAFLGSIIEADTPSMLALHLRIRKGRISAAETLVQRSEKSARGFEEIGYTWRDAVPGERMSRAELLQTANLYFSGMQQNDGKGAYPFDDDCNRIENGTFTTNVPTPPGETRPDPATASTYSSQWSCREQFESGLLHFVSRIRDRRFVAVDPERGLVFSYVFFDHMAGEARTFRAPDGRTVSSAGPQQPWTWEIAEAFRIEHHKIHEIVAIMEKVPYGMNSGWSTWQEGMSSEGRDASR